MNRTLNYEPAQANLAGRICNASRVRLSVQWAVIAVILLVPLALFAAALLKDNAAIARHNEALGNQVVQALERYKTANGTYPNTLDPLVPAFIPAIPKPKSAQWAYLPDRSGNGFGLFFEGGDDDPVGSYDSNSRCWGTDTK